MSESKLTSGQKNYNKYVAWKATMTDEAYRQIVNTKDGTLLRSEVAKGCGFAVAALRQNTAIRPDFKELENDLRARRILPDKTDSAKANESKSTHYDRKSGDRARDSMRVTALEQQVLELKARLKRYEELAEVLAERGMDL